MSITGEPTARRQCSVSVRRSHRGLYHHGLFGGLHQRERTGRGCHIDLAMFDALLSMMDDGDGRTSRRPCASRVGNRQPLSDRSEHSHRRRPHRVCSAERETVRAVLRRIGARSSGDHASNRTPSEPQTRRSRTASTMVNARSTRDASPHCQRGLPPPPSMTSAAVDSEHTVSGIVPSGT